MSTDASSIRRSKQVMTIVGPGSTIDSIKVADCPTTAKYSEGNDNDDYSLLGPQLQSSTPHMDRAITEISEFDPLILRTPQRSNIAKSKQQEEEPTPH
eukprot:5371475-Ditylum_brightwellii.AAC.1